MNTFLFTNISLTLLSFLAFVYIYFKERYLFIKPSIILLLYSHIFIQWPLVYFVISHRINLPSPYELMLLVHGYIVVGLLLSVFLFRNKAKYIWDKVTTINPAFICKDIKKAIWILFIVLVIVFGIYINYVGLSNTGLYYLFTNPAKANIARENSMKLLESDFIKYIYSIGFSSIAFYLTALIANKIRVDLKKRNFLSVLLDITMLSFVALFVSITGAKSGLIYMLAVICLLFLWEKKLSFNLVYLFTLIILCLLPGAFLAMLSEASSFDVNTCLIYFETILNRAFIIPFQTGMWHVDYAQNYGLLGISGIKKLAAFFDVKYIDVPNMIGLKYVPSYYTIKPIIQTISATAGYLFSYYIYFGISSLVLSLLFMLVLDISLFIYSNISNNFLLPLIAVVTLTTLSFVQSDYTTVLFSGGFMTTLIMVVLLNKILIRKNSKE